MPASAVAEEPVGSSIIDPGRRIVDAHHHLFERPQRRYLADEYRADLRAGHDVVASCYMEAGGFPRLDGDPGLRALGEVEFANGVGAMGAGGWFAGARPCAAISGHADLRAGAAVGRLLDECLSRAPDRFRGVRQLAIDHPSDAAFRLVPNRPPRGLLTDAAFKAGLAEVADRGLVFDVGIYHVQFADFARLAEELPTCAFVLDHMGMVFAMGASAEEREDLRREWAAGLLDLARLPNVTCKVGGLGMPVWGFGFEKRDARPDDVELAAAWRPYVEAAIDAFGAERCMFESNFPIDAASCGYAELWNAFKRIVSGCSPAEKEALFVGTAARTYRIDLPDVEDAR